MSENSTTEVVVSTGVPRYVVQGSEVTGWLLLHQNPFIGLVPIGSFKRFEEAQEGARKDFRKSLD